MTESIRQAGRRAAWGLAVALAAVSGHADDSGGAPPAPAPAGPGATSPPVAASHRRTESPFPAEPYRGVVVPAPSTSVTVRGEVQGRDGDPWTHVFDVPEDVIALEATLETDRGDADLYLAFGEEEPQDDEWTFFGEEGAYREHVRITRSSESDWEPGPLFASVEPGDQNDGLTEASKIAFRLTLTLLRRAPAVPLTLGRMVEAATGPESAHRVDFVLDVPRNVPVVRLDLIDAERDLDVLVATDAHPIDDDEAAWYTTSMRTRETLVVGVRDGAKGGTKLGAPTKLFVSVVDSSEYDSPVRFRLAATPGAGPPSSLPALPRLVVPTDPQDLALASVVEVVFGRSSGSGTIVSAEGLVLTARHVIDDGAKCGEVVVALDLDETRGAEDLFLARCVKEDEDLDLALLRIVSDVWGRPLPEGYRFPFCRPAERGPLRLGEEVFTVGFGETGGSGSRTPVMLSRGVLSGFEREKAGLRAKTDALIVGGSSGGAVFDRDFAFIGVPLFTISGEGGATRLGYFMPLAELAEDWREAIAAKR